MRFHHQTPVSGKHQRRRFRSAVLVLLATVSLAAGLYLLLLALTPNIPVLYPVEEINARELPEPSGDRIYIPKIGVSTPLVTGGPEVLDQGAWHRFPERGDPVAGGNFIISAHRFSMGFTPQQTRQKSPFYHIDKLAVGDQLLVDFQGKRYGYEIEKAYQVKPDQTEIEAVSDEAKLTLYTCTLKGESDGREVFVAKPLGEVKDGAVERSAATR